MGREQEARFSLKIRERDTNPVPFPFHGPWSNYLNHKKKLQKLQNPRHNRFFDKLFCQFNHFSTQLQAHFKQPVLPLLRTKRSRLPGQPAPKNILNHYWPYFSKFAILKLAMKSWQYGQHRIRRRNAAVNIQTGFHSTRKVKIPVARPYHQLLILNFVRFKIS